MPVTKSRDYQVEAIDASWTALQDQRSTLVVMPTGSGKTHVFCKLIGRWNRRKRSPVLVLAAARDLVKKAAESIHMETHLPVSIEMAEQSVSSKQVPPIVCGSVQSVTRRFGGFKKNAFGLIVIDEADLALAPSYQRIVDYFGAKVFGCTATPNRHDGKAMSEMFDSVAYRLELVDLVRQRYLAPIKRRAVKVLDLSRVRTHDGDFDPRQLDEILQEEKHLHEVVKPTLELAGDRPTVVFGVSIRHSELLSALFNRYRPGCALAVHSKSFDRDAIIGKFRTGKIQFLCNCALINRGIDIPKISCVAMARPTQSLTLYMQSLGRGTRTHKGKDNLLVLDFTSNSYVHGLVTAIDALGGHSTAEEVERAKEIDEEQDAEQDVTELLETAAEQLANDAELRSRVQAKVSFREQEVVGIDWETQPWSTHTNVQIAKSLGVSPSYTGAHRPGDIPTPDTVWSIHRKIKHIEWKSQPWRTESDIKMSKRLGVSKGTVRKHRPSHIKSPGSRAPIDIDWSTMPWDTHTNVDISKIAGCAKQTPARHRPKSRPGPYGNTINWESLPWDTHNNNQIARILKSHGKKVSGNLVGYHRPKDSPNPYRSSPYTDPANVDWNSQDWDLHTNKEIASMTGCSEHSVMIRRPKGKRSKRRLRKIDHDWSMIPLGKESDADISARFGIKRGTVKVTRNRLGIPHFRGGK